MEWYDILALALTVLILIAVIIIAYKANYKFRDKSLGINKGMNEEQVLDIMEEDPVAVEQIKNGIYEWVYEFKKWVGWATKTMKIEIIFDKDGLVTSVERSNSYDGPGSKKEN